MDTNDLASLIVDAIDRAGLLKKEDVPRAITIAEEEIDARKAIGDY